MTSTADRIAAAKAAAQAAITAARPVKAQANRSPTNSPKQRAATAQTQIAETSTPSATSPSGGKTGATAGKGKQRNPSPRANRQNSFPPPVVFTPERHAAVVASLRAMSARPAALAAHEQDTVEAVQAMIAGAKIVGPAGHGDRMTLFRMVGLPLSPGTGLGGGSKGDVVRAIGQLGERLERGLGARDGHRSGGVSRDPVTVDAVLIEEAPSNGAFAGYTHKIGDLVRMPDGQLSASGTVEAEAARDLPHAQPAPSQAPEAPPVKAALPSWLRK